MIVLLAIGVVCPAQYLKVEKSNKVAIDRSTSDGEATIMFESSVKDLEVSTTLEDDIQHLPGAGKTSYYVVYVDPIRDTTDLQMYVSERTFTLSSPESFDYTFTTPEILPNQVQYYTVVLPDNYPLLFSLEYVYSMTSLCGLRFSAGTRWGGYVGYKWGKYYKAGVNIDTFTQDRDITRASYLGNIRQSITAGLRIGLNAKVIPVYMYIGAGYGEYGRQWQNPVVVDNSVYFYSDYLKGADLELGAMINWKFLYASLGVEMVVQSTKKPSVEFQFGVGLALDKKWCDNIKKKK